MSANRDAINSSEEFELITEKRLALESLIKIASGIHNQQKALNELALAARPSQNIPKSIARSFSSIKKKLEDDDISDIIKKLEKIELITKKTLLMILQLTSVDVHLLRTDQVKSITTDNFTAAIRDFKRRTQTTLALRYVLRERGAVIPPFKLSISQESIYEQLEQLKQKENECVETIKIEINIIIVDTATMMRKDYFSDSMKSDLIQINKAMTANLEYLENGGLITRIPHAVETITLETTPSFTPDEADDNDDLVKSKLDEKPSNGTKGASQKRSFWWLFEKWISSPWSTSWSSVKKKYQDQPEDE